MVVARPQETVPYLRAQMGAVPAGLGVGAQEQVLVQVECMKPFSGAPGLDVCFVASGVTYKYVEEIFLCVWSHA